MSSGDSSNVNRDNNKMNPGSNNSAGANPGSSGSNGANPGSGGSNMPPPSNGIGPIRVTLGVAKDERTAARPYPQLNVSQPNVTQTPDGTLNININLIGNPASGRVSGQLAQAAQQANGTAPSASAPGDKEKVFILKQTKIFL